MSRLGFQEEQSSSERGIETSIFPALAPIHGGKLADEVVVVVPPLIETPDDMRLFPAVD
jgi:hypothetical protein